MSSSHKTSAIARPRRSSARAQTSTGGEHARLKDLTQPIAIERRLVRRRGNRWLLALLAVGVIGALAAALFVLPVQAWLHQQTDIDAKQAELAVLTKANDQLGVENDRLKTPEGAKEAARDELGVTDPGEQRVSVLPGGNAPLTLPTGWPYDTVTQILSARTAIVAAQAAQTAQDAQAARAAASTSSGAP